MMKKLFTLTVFFLAICAATFAQSPADEIIGIWESDKKDVRMEFFRSGNEYQGRLLWGNLIVEKDGLTSKKDTKNPTESLRTRNIIGITSLTGLHWKDGEYENGSIYNPPTGDTYKCKAWIKNGKLQVRGYLGISLLGQTVSWHRYQQ